MSGAFGRRGATAKTIYANCWHQRPYDAQSEAVLYDPDCTDRPGARGGMSSQIYPIPGGYILLARKLLESELMNKPPHYLKLWVWMLCKAFWKDGDKMNRGQFISSIGEMQEALTYRVGARVVKPSVDEIRGAYRYMAESGTITVAKTTRGIIITICNFEYYQAPMSYETRTDYENQPKPITEPAPQPAPQPAQDQQLTVCNYNENMQGLLVETHVETRVETTPNPIRQMKKEKDVKNTCASSKPKRSTRPPSGDHQTFIAWWSFAYEKIMDKPYLISGKDVKAVADLLKVHTIKPLVVMGSYFLTCSDSWLGSKRDLPMFYNRINQIPGHKDSAHDADAYRTVGIIPPEGVKFEEWSFWEQHDTLEAA